MEEQKTSYWGWVVIIVLVVVYNLGQSYIKSKYDEGYKAGQAVGHKKGYSEGYIKGRTPTDQEIKNAQIYHQVSTDVAALSDKYSTLYGLCEEKYQTALDGDVGTAIRINGQMDAILSDINEINAKYDTNAELQ